MSPLKGWTIALSIYKAVRGFGTEEKNSQDRSWLVITLNSPHIKCYYHIYKVLRVLYPLK